jgi:hypothetical protein
MSLSLNETETKSDYGKLLSAVKDSKILRGAFVHRRGENAEDERRVAEYWRANGFMVEALEDPSERFSRLPDFRLYHEGQPWAYCEVKTVWRHSWTVRILHQDRPAEEHLEVSNKPVEERLSGDLVTAIRQLRSGNPGHALLNIVVLVNRDEEASLAGLSQLFSAQTVAIHRGRGDRQAARLAAEIKGFCHDVDLCIWATEHADGMLSVEAYFFFNAVLQEQVKKMIDLEYEKLIVLDPAA